MWRFEQWAVGGLGAQVADTPSLPADRDADGFRFRSTF